MTYPEHDKLAALVDSGKRDAVQGFIDWLHDEAGYDICEFVEYDGPLVMEESVFVPVRDSRERLMARYFGVDLNKQAEKRQMLDLQRAHNTAASHGKGSS